VGLGGEARRDETGGQIKDGPRVRLYSRPGNDLTGRFPLIVEALARLRSRSCIIDGEAVVCGDNGIASFDRIRHRWHDGDAFLYAFDLIELNGATFAATRLKSARRRSRPWVAKASPGIRFNEPHRGRRPDRLRACLQDGARRYRLEAQGLALSLGSLARLAQDEEPGLRRREAGGGGGLGAVISLLLKRVGCSHDASDEKAVGDHASMRIDDGVATSLL
jgi:ATP dependent DNA ligase domain